MPESRKGSHHHIMNDENYNPNNQPRVLAVAINKKEQHAAATLITVEFLSIFTRSIPLNKVYRLDLDIRNQNLPPIRNITGLHHVFNLKVLSLSGNAISDLDGLSCLSHLVELNLSENNFRKLDNLEKHLSKSLVRLNLSGNQIQRIPATISTLTRLSVLRLAQNGLEVVSDLQHLKPLHRLRQLRLEDNPFSSIEKTIPFALFCVPSLDIINGCEIMPNERRDASQRFQHLVSNDHDVPAAAAAAVAMDTTTSTSHTEWNTTGIHNNAHHLFNNTDTMESLTKPNPPTSLPTFLPANRHTLSPSPYLTYLSPYLPTDTLSPIVQTSNPWGHHNIQAESAFHLRMAMNGNESSMEGHPIRLGHLSAYAAVDTKHSLPDTVMCQPISTTVINREKTSISLSNGLNATAESSQMKATEASPFTPDSISHKSNRNNNNNNEDNSSSSSCRSLDFLDTPTDYPPVVIHQHLMDTSVDTSVELASSPYSTSAAATAIIADHGSGGSGGSGTAKALSPSLEILDLHDRIEQLTTRLLTSETARDVLIHTHHQLQQDLCISQNNEKHLEDIILTLQNKVDESDQQAELVLQRLFLENQELRSRIQGMERQTKDDDSEVQKQLEYWQKRCSIAEGELRTIKEEIGLLDSVEGEATTTTAVTATATTIPTAVAGVATSSTIPTIKGLVDNDYSTMDRPSCANVVVGVTGNDMPCSRCSNYYEGMQHAVVLQGQTMVALEASERRVEGLKKALSLVSLVQLPSVPGSYPKGVSLDDIDEMGVNEEKEEVEEGVQLQRGKSPLVGTFATLQRDVVELERSKQQIVDTITSLHVTLASLQQQRASFSEENDLLNQQATALAVDVARLEDQKEGVLARMPELLKQVAVAEEQGVALVHIRAEREGLDAAIASLSKEKRVLEREKEVLDRQLRDVRGEIVVLGGERHMAEEAVRMQQEVLIRLMGEEQTLRGAVAAAEEAAGVALAKVFICGV